MPNSINKLAGTDIRSLSVSKRPVKSRNRQSQRRRKENSHVRIGKKKKMMAEQKSLNRVRKSKSDRVIGRCATL